MKLSALEEDVEQEEEEHDETEDNYSNSILINPLPKKNTVPLSVSVWKCSSISRSWELIQDESMKLKILKLKFILLHLEENVDQEKEDHNKLKTIAVSPLL